MDTPTPTQPTATSPHIILIVIGTLAIMALTYVGTLAYCVIKNLQVQGDIIRAFEAAGIFALGAFTGVLANTRTQQAPDAPTLPQTVKISNKPDEPVPVTEKP